MGKELDDVQEIVTPAEGEGSVEGVDPKGDDKSKNFAELRKKLEEAQRERDEALAKLNGGKPDDRNLNANEDDDEKKGKTDPLKIIFQRDLKEATRQWNSSNKVTAEEWAAIKSKVSLSGEETVSEIKDKIDEAYHSLPSVRERRDKELIEKGKKEAMRQFQDDELDEGGGGESDFSGEQTVRLNNKTKTWAQGLGLSKDEISKIDLNGDPSDWQIGPNATRKFFQP